MSHRIHTQKGFPGKQHINITGTSPLNKHFTLISYTSNSVTAHHFFLFLLALFVGVGIEATEGMDPEETGAIGGGGSFLGGADLSVAILVADFVLESTFLVTAFPTRFFLRLLQRPQHIQR